MIQGASPRHVVRVTLRMRVVSFFLLASVLPSALAGYLAYHVIAGQAQGAAEREVVTIAESAAKTATEFMNSRCSDILVWANLRMIREALDSAEARPDASENLREMVAVSAAYEAAALVDLRGQCIATSWPTMTGTSFSGNEVFNRAKTGSIALGSLEQSTEIRQLDPESKGWSLVVGAPVKVAGKVEGALLAYLKWKPLELILTGTRVGQTGFVYVVDSNGRIVVHPDEKLYGTVITQAATDFSRLADALQAGNSSTTYERFDQETGKRESRMAGIAYPGKLTNLPELGWKIVAEAPTREVLLLPNIVQYLAIIAGVVGVLVLALSVVLASNISRPIVALASVAVRVSGRDLTVHAPDVARSDEIGDLVTAFGSMIENLKHQINTIFEGIEVLNHTASEISDSVSRVASGTAEVASSVSETAATLEELRQSSKIAGERARQVAEWARQAVSASIEGGKATQGTIEQMQMIKDEQESVLEKVANLSRQGDSIEQIMATVQDLADQSRLLAVNASIESARAGEMGKGFGVVALEIKHLADESRDAGAQVRAILEDTRKRISDVAMSTAEVKGSVEAGIFQSSKTGDAIAMLNKTIQMSSEAANVIDGASAQQDAAMDQVATAMTSIDEAVGRNLENAGRLEDAAKKINNLATELRQTIEQYRT